MRKQYVDDGMYDNYYLGQVGSGGSAFAGDSYQRGHGIGGIFRGLFRAATPLLKRGVMAIGKQIIRSGGRVAYLCIVFTIDYLRLVILVTPLSFQVFGFALSDICYVSIQIYLTPYSAKTYNFVYNY